MTKQGCKMERIANNGNMQVADNKGNNFFYFPMISMACTGSGYTQQVIYGRGVVAFKKGKLGWHKSMLN